ncbi:PREDICTED: farnesol dehydrogenase-like [Nicrophorus vespilloides]|uniref:Farnesol dehydrogenase-like n=1 Tax=Nicrophorus vespilloides TaxID=110193 RepID=A0ABM1N2I1_NICVS|nr:PREDICTED: farnesol dehydrogenase-like [Nicrophorus vespilloides]
MNRWVGKVCVVTGASSGIGASLAEKLVDHGVVVVGLARRMERLEESATVFAGKAGKFHPYRCDITKNEEIINAFKWTTSTIGPISILINNAGFTNYTTLTDGDETIWKRVLDTNVMGLCLATREAVRSMKSNGIDGHIVHVNSIGGHTPYLNNMYPPSKFAVTCITEVMRKELIQAGSKIKVSSISPGATDTEMLRAHSQEFVDTNKFPMLNAEDVADSIVHILGTPPHVQIHELIIKPVGEIF